MSAAGVDRLLSDIRTLLPIDGVAEITLEANPGTFETEKFRSFRQSGINRLSVGIQSFNSRTLLLWGVFITAMKLNVQLILPKHILIISISI
jgi:oxygen-independent coproporphyrinogen-3 oxidase